MNRRALRRSSCCGDSDRNIAEVKTGQGAHSRGACSDGVRTSLIIGRQGGRGGDSAGIGNGSRGDRPVESRAGPRGRRCETHRHPTQRITVWILDRGLQGGIEDGVHRCILSRAGSGRNAWAGKGQRCPVQTDIARTGSSYPADLEGLSGQSGVIHKRVIAIVSAADCAGGINKVRRRSIRQVSGERAAAVRAAHMHGQNPHCGVSRSCKRKSVWHRVKVDAGVVRSRGGRRSIGPAERSGIIRIGLYRSSTDH